MKKYFIRLLTMWILTISLILTFNTAVYAGSSNIFPGVSRSCVIKGYCYRVHDVSRKRVNVYYNESCSSRNSREYVSAQTDECYITGTSGGYNNVRITYPTSSGRKERWTIMGVFTSATSCSIRYATAKIPTYKFASTRYGYGSISRNDQVRVYETWRGYVRVVYPISGGYKIAWITEANANRYLSGYSNAGYVNISEGTYKITTALNTGYALDVNNYATFNGGNVEIYPYHDTNNEKWRITSVGNGYYRITDVNSGKPLDVSGGGSASGTNVQIWESNNTNAQKWRFINAGNGYYYIVNANGCYLDVQNGTVRNGNNVWVYSGNGSNAQKWRLTGVTVGQNNSGSNNSNDTTYAPYTGVRYDNIGLSNQRIIALNKAKNMVTIRWKAPADFPTWCSQGGSYNTVKSTDGTQSKKFIKGKTYTGVPYSMKGNSWDDIIWKNNLNSLTTGKMTGTYYSHGKKTTAHGIDCSYFVYTALRSAVPSYGLSYMCTSEMLKSSSYRKISLSQIKPGDIFLKKGHVMMYVGRSNGKYAVFEADSNDSKCSYNVYSYGTIKNYGCYKFKGFND